MSFHFGAEIKRRYPLLNEMEYLLRESSDALRENLLAVLPYFTGDATSYQHDTHYTHLCRVRRITDGLQEGDDDERLPIWIQLLSSAEGINRTVIRRGLTPARIAYGPIIRAAQGGRDSYRFGYCDLGNTQVKHNVTEALNTLAEDGYGITIPSTLVDVLLNPKHTISFAAFDQNDQIQGLVIGTSLEVERNREKVRIFYVWFCCRSSRATGMGLAEACKEQLTEDLPCFQNAGIQYYAAHFPTRIPYLSNLVGELQPDYFFECPSALFKQQGRLYLKRGKKSSFRPTFEEISHSYYQCFRSEVWFFTAWWYSKLF